MLRKLLEGGLGLIQLALEGFLGLLVNLCILLKLLEALLELGLKVSRSLFLIFKELIKRFDFALKFAANLLDFLGEFGFLVSQF